VRTFHTTTGLADSNFMSREHIQTEPGCGDPFAAEALSIEAAARCIEAGMVPIRDREEVPLRDALGRILAEDVLSPINVPSHVNSAVDGYAMRSADLPSRGSANLTLIGTAWAGRPCGETVQPGQCIRIMTGAKMPDGTDTVVMQEHAERTEAGIRVGEGHRPGQNVRLAGEDLAAGHPAAGAGKKITPAALGLLASLGIPRVAVTRRLRVAFFATGDELRSIGEPLGDGEIYDSNRYTLYGMLAHLGVDQLDLGVVADTPEAIRGAFNQAADRADVIITTGGVSVGEADYVKEVITDLGEVTFGKIAIKPGRPLAFGRVGRSLFFGLPGNPVAVMVTFYQLVQPALRRMMGETRTSPARFEARCLSRLKKRPGRTEFQRGRLTVDADGRVAVSKTGAQGSGILSSMSAADCFIVLPPESGTVEPGDTVWVEPFEGIA
jgi:molybdopterin molybdotransferase